MKLTLSELTALTQHPEFVQIPGRLALDKYGHYTWGNLSDVLVDEGLKSACWQVGHLTAILFDTYNHAVRDVFVGTNMYLSNSSARLSLDMSINTMNSHDSEELRQKTKKGLAEVDNLEVYLAVFKGMKVVADERFASKVDQMRRLLGRHITSAQQAREVAQTAAPEIEAWAKAQLLALHAHPSDRAPGTMSPKL